MASLENLNNKRKGYAPFSFRKNNNNLGRDRNIAEQHAELLKKPADKSRLGGHRMLINADQDDQMEICGYRISRTKQFITYLFIGLTLGLLRIVFHWLPHLYLKARCNTCEVTEADFVLITEIFNGKHKTYYVKELKTLTMETLQASPPDAVQDNRARALSVHFDNGIFREVDKLLTFTCKKVTYIWDSDKQIFVKLRGLDHDVSSPTLHKNKGLTRSEQHMRRMVYGPNQIIVKESTVLTLLFLEVLNPYYIFQFASFILWSLDDYYYYAAAILIMSLYGMSTSVIQTRSNQRNLKSRVHSSDLANVLTRDEQSSFGDSFADGKCETVDSSLLVPGDILEIPPHGCIMQCDAILLTGNCILNESMLTGESVPVTKTPFPNIKDLYYEEKEHARHTLFCGTQVIQTRYFGNEKVLAVVIRTGFSTAKGGLVRSILYPPPVDFRFEKDSYRFVTMLACVAGCGFIYTVVTKAMRGIPATDLILEALDLITIVVPPSLPAAMTIGRMHADSRLRKNNIFCISPRSINVSGSIDCVCFDKTGTLTEDGLDLLCVVPANEKNFESPIKDVESLPYNVFVCGLVSCHSLTIIDKQITGDPLDLKMFESTKWSIEDPEVSDNTKFDMIFPTVLIPPKNRSSDNLQQDIDLQIGIIREFPFSSSAQRMGVIIRKLGATHFEYYSKGSPEMILNFVRKDTVPDNFSEVLESYTQEGYRVIAIAHKELKITYPKAQKVQREAIENEMTFLGLIVLENRLKIQTTPSIEVLNAASIRVVMVTGDNILTAVSVARDCGIITQSQSVITVNVDGKCPSEVYYTLATTKNKNADNSILSNSSSIVSLDTVESQTATNHGAVCPTSSFNNYRFALTGKVWAVIKDEHPDLIPKLVTRGSIFARMSPDQKQQLVQELQGLGYYVAMCGDGANDCGALKAAHTGISLSDAESSIASPFTAKDANIQCVLNIVREGRAALVTSFGIFKYMASYSMCQFVSVMILYSIDSNLTDFEYLYIDLFIIASFAFFFGRTEAYQGKLVKETPLNSLMSFSPILSLAVQLLVVCSVQVVSFFHLKSTDWYEPFDASQKDDKDSVACVENYTLFTISSFQYIILAIVFSKGKPYRKSIFTNYGMVASAVILTGISIYLAIEPFDWLKDVFELVIPENLDFRLYLIGYAAINFVLSILLEVFFIEEIVFKRLRFKFHNVYKSKRKYIAIEKDLNDDPKWPTLTSSYRSSESPLTPLPSVTAEIVFESEKFDKNHVLNSFYKNDSPPRNYDSSKSTPTYTNAKNASSEFQSAINITASDASFKTAEMPQSLPNSPKTNGDVYLSFKPMTNGLMTSEPYINHLQNYNKRMRTLSSNGEATFEMNEFEPR